MKKQYANIWVRGFFLILNIYDYEKYCYEYEKIYIENEKKTYLQNKSRSKKNVEKGKVNVDDCLQEQTELIKKLTNQFEELK